MKLVMQGPGANFSKAGGHTGSGDNSGSFLPEETLDFITQKVNWRTVTDVLSKGIPNHRPLGG